MKSYPLLFISFLLIVVLGILHFTAVFFYFYWTIWWFDIMMHFLGGLSLGVFLLWIFHVSGLFGLRIPSRRQAFLTSLISVALIGLGWEIFEYAFGISSTEKNYALDTSVDLLADMAGAFLAGFVGLNRGLYAAQDNG